MSFLFCINFNSKYNEIIKRIFLVMLINFSLKHEIPNPLTQNNEKKSLFTSIFLKGNDTSTIFSQYFYNKS